MDEKGNTTFVKNENNPTGYQETRRVDVKGGEHTNKDGKVVPTPHVHTKGSKDVIPAVKGEHY